jgi:hypothetical protein
LDLEPIGRSVKKVSPNQVFSQISAGFDLLRERVAATLQPFALREIAKNKSCCHTIIALVVDKHTVQTQILF